MNIENRSILLVEDNPMDVDLTRRAFKKHGIENPIVVARDGEEALSSLGRWGKDETLPLVILLDLKLPKVDGLEILNRIKTHERFRTVPVVVLSTSSEDSDIQAAYREGANSYIVKPVDFDRFMDVVDQIQRYWCTINVPPP
jgi:CheY-like chemotaxis protein